MNKQVSESITTLINHEINNTNIKRKIPIFLGFEYLKKLLKAWKHGQNLEVFVTVELITDIAN